MKTLLRNVFHFVTFTIILASFIYNQINVKDEKGGGLFGYKGLGGKFKYLTFWYFCIQTLYFGITVVNDLCGSNVVPSDKGQKKTLLQKFRDFFLATIVFPVGIFVVLTFWGVYVVDREFLYPKALDKIIPQWLMFVVLTFWGVYVVDREFLYPKALDKIIPQWLMHTTNLPFLLVEKYIVYHQYPTRKSGISTMLVFAMLYLVWILWIAYYANIWVYPILRVLQPHQRAVFIIVLLFLFVGLYLLGEIINKFFWGKERSALQTKQVRFTQKTK